MLFSVIEFQDAHGNIMVSRIPEEGTAEFTFGSQLLVQEGQTAIFFRDGKPTDIFTSGRYTLDTNNLPVLSKLLKLATFGTRSPFRAYVYFIQLKTFTNLGWGTSSPILFRDAEFKAVHLRAHGCFSIRVASPQRFVQTVIGSRGVETTAETQDFLRRVIASRLANLLPSKLTTVLDLAACYQDIEVALKHAVRDDLLQYGLELVDLLVEAITVPPEVSAMINRAAGSRSLDPAELDRYQRMAAADALRDAARQPGAGVVTANLSAEVGGGSVPPRLTPDAPQAASDRLTVDQVKAKLRDLQELLTEGLISQEDFDGQKKRLLERI